MIQTSIIEAQPFHCGRVSRRLRSEHALAVARLGLSAHRELRDRFDASWFRRAWMIDGELAAVGGVTGSVLSSTGFVWLAVTDVARRNPRATIEQARRALDELMLTKHELVTTILDGDAASLRFAIFLGFVPAGSNGHPPAHSVHGRRLLRVVADGDDESRVALGSGSAIALVYRKRERS